MTTESPKAESARKRKRVDDSDRYREWTPIHTNPSRPATGGPARFVSIRVDSR